MQVGLSPQLMDFREAATNPAKRGMPNGEIAARKLLREKPEEFHTLWARLEKEQAEKEREFREHQREMAKITKTPVPQEEKATERETMLEELLSKEWAKVKDLVD